MNVEVFVICDAATESNGKLNILGAFDTILLRTVPAVHQSSAMVVRLRLTREEEGEHKFSFSILDMEGKPLLPPLEGAFTIEYTGEGNTASINVIARLGNVKFEKLGEYVVSLCIDGKEQARLPLFLKELL